MDKKAIVSFLLLTMLCGIHIISLAAVKTDRQNTNMQMMPREVYTAIEIAGRLPQCAGCKFRQT